MLGGVNFEDRGRVLLARPAADEVDGLPRRHDAGLGEGLLELRDRRPRPVPRSIRSTSSVGFPPCSPPRTYRLPPSANACALARGRESTRDGHELPAERAGEDAPGAGAADDGERRPDDRSGRVRRPGRQLPVAAAPQRAPLESDRDHGPAAPAGPESRRSSRSSWRPWQPQCGGGLDRPPDRDPGCCHDPEQHDEQRPREGRPPRPPLRRRRFPPPPAGPGRTAAARGHGATADPGGLGSPAATRTIAGHGSDPPGPRDGAATSSLAARLNLCSDAITPGFLLPRHVRRTCEEPNLVGLGARDGARRRCARGVGRRRVRALDRRHAAPGCDLLGDSEPGWQPARRLRPAAAGLGPLADHPDDEGDRLRVQRGRLEGRELHPRLPELRRLDGSGRQVGLRHLPDERLRLRLRRQRRRRDRDVQLRLRRDRDPDPEPRPERPARDGQPGEHLRRPDARRPRHGGRRAREVLPDGSRATTRASSRPTTSRVRPTPRSRSSSKIKKLFILNDKEAYGAGVATNVVERRQEARASPS